MGIGLEITFLITDFAQLIHGNFTILGSRLYSPNLMDVAGLEDAQLVVISYTFVYFFPTNCVDPAKFTDKCMEN